MLHMSAMPDNSLMSAKCSAAAVSFKYLPSIFDTGFRSWVVGFPEDSRAAVVLTDPSNCTVIYLLIYFIAEQISPAEVAQGTVPKAPITMGTNFTFVLFPKSAVRGRYLKNFSSSLSIISGSHMHSTSRIRAVFCWLPYTIKLGQVALILSLFSINP